MNKRILSIATILSMIVIYFSLTSSSTGITNQTGGCSCHGAASANTIIGLSGFPTNYVNGQAYTITATVTNTAKVAAGFDLKVTAGTISAPSAGATINGTTEVGHNAPLSMTSGVSSWTFTWTAPASGSSVVTCNMAGLATNGDGQTSGDLHNIKTVTIAGPLSNVGITATFTAISCNGSSSTITATGTGGTVPYTYKINTANYVTTNTATVTAGTYTVFVKDASLATSSTIVTITQPTAITANVANFTHVMCNAMCNGSATMSASGGTGALTYAWSTTPVQTTATATNLCAGTYTCIVKDANNCTKSSLVTISQPSLPLIISNVASTLPSCVPGNDGTITLTIVGGTVGYTYKLNNVTKPSNIFTNIGVGTYTILVTDANGCTVTTVKNIASAVGPTLTISNKVNVTCNGGNNGSVCATATNGVAPFSYLWNNGTPTSCNNNLQAGTYTCTVTDANGCTATTTSVITQPMQIMATSTSSNISCANGIGSVTATATGGTTPFSYSWMPGNIMTATATGLALGTYTCTIKDANNCIVTTTASVIQANNMVVNIAGTNIQCFGTNNGTATTTVTGGALPLTYSWAPITATTANLTNMNAGTYTLTVTDAGTCTKTQTVLILQPNSLLTASVSNVANILCNGASTGAATLVGAGGTPGYTYSWNTNPPQATATVSNLTAGTYTATLTDANSCTKTTTLTITQSASMNITTTNTNILCNGGNNGTASVTVTGGNAPYMYMWNPGGISTASVTGLLAGTYTVAVADANNCTKSSAVIITQPIQIINTALQGNPSCKNGSNGFASLTTSGGTLPYTYLWTPSGITTPNLSNATAGSYTCIITDANNCTTSQIINIAASSDTANAQFTQTSSVLNAIQPNASYQWLKCNPISIISNAIAQNFTVLTNGPYALTVRSGSCIDTSDCVNIILNGVNDIKKSGNTISKVSNTNFQFNNVSANIITYKILNTNGATVATGKLANGLTVISCENFTKGMYILQANKEVFKLIVE